MADRRLPLRLILSASLVLTSLACEAYGVAFFLIVQGAFSFILIETINYVQHYRRPGTPDAGQAAKYANQDLNLVSRYLLFNLPLHAAHHVRPALTYSELTPISGAATFKLGYWWSFWLAWSPYLWDRLHQATEGNPS
jgi:hypothetical protein